MKRVLLATLLCGSAVLVRADFTYQETTQMTGGALVTTLKALGPLTRAAREPIVSTHIVKGNRMATITKDRVSVIDLDKETITTIDNAKKTYSVMTFAEMKQALEDAAKRMQGRQKNNKGEDVQAQFKVSAKATGQTRTLQGLSAKEMIITMAMEGQNKSTGDTGAMEITTDAWYAPVPGYQDGLERRLFDDRPRLPLLVSTGQGQGRATIAFDRRAPLKPADIPEFQAPTASLRERARDALPAIVTLTTYATVLLALAFVAFSRSAI